MLIILALPVCRFPVYMNHCQNSVFKDLWKLALLLSQIIYCTHCMPQDTGYC